MPERRRRAAVLAPSRRARPPADPRRAILEAFVQTVARRGYARATLAEALALAGVPAPVFAEHFESKGDCLQAALEDCLARIARAIAQRDDASGDWCERVRSSLAALLGVLADHPDEASIVFVECLGAGEPAFARVRAALARCVPVLEQGRSESAIASWLPPQTGEAIAGGIASIVHKRVLEGRQAELPALLPDLLCFALTPYLGAERALAQSRAAA